MKATVQFTQRELTRLLTREAKDCVTLGEDPQVLSVTYVTRMVGVGDAVLECVNVELSTKG